MWKIYYQGWNEEKKTEKEGDWRGKMIEGRRWKERREDEELSKKDIGGGHGGREKKFC